MLSQVTSLEEKGKIEQEIIKLSSGIKNIEDMIALDEAIQDLILTL